MDNLDKATGENWVVASTSGVNVRKGAGTNHAIVGSLALGAAANVTKVSEDSQWGYVPASGGWIWLEPCCKGAPSSWVVTASSLNLRGKADETSKSLAMLPKNTRVTVTAIAKKNFTWGQVAYAQKPDGEWHMREGWVALDYCKKA